MYCNWTPDITNDDEHQSHTSRVAFLDDLAALAGFTLSLRGRLADGLRPDVVRIDTSKRAVFFGEAKHTEHPSCRATRFRMLRYFHWVSALQKYNNAMSVFAVCFGQKEQTTGWIDAVSKTARGAGVSWTDYTVSQFGTELVVVWFSAAPVRRAPKSKTACSPTSSITSRGMI
jgi:hypothetical protein